jgi:hypothetical protein
MIQHHQLIRPLRNPQQIDARHIIRDMLAKAPASAIRAKGDRFRRGFEARYHVALRGGS